MTSKIRWGILSTAGIGDRRVVPAIRQSSNGEVAAVASRSVEKARDFASRHNIPRAYGSYEELIANPDIDAIYNPLPNSEHAVWSIRCAEAGKPTLCEKPLAKDAAEAQTMVETFRARGVLFAEAFMYRFHPQTVKVKELVDSGAVGQLKVMTSAFTFKIRDEDNIRLNKSLAGGSLMDVGCYCINVMRLMTGEEPVRMQAAARIGERSGVDEQLAGLLVFPSGVMGHFDCGLRSQHNHSYEIRGTDGRIVVEKGFTPGADEATVIRLWQGDQYQEIAISAVNQYTLMAEDFAAVLLDGRPPRYAPEDGVANMRVIDGLLASI